MGETGRWPAVVTTVMTASAWQDCDCWLVSARSVCVLSKLGHGNVAILDLGVVVSIWLSPSVLFCCFVR